MEVTQVPTNRWMGKEDVVYIYNGIILSHKKEEWNLAICNNRDGPRWYYAKWDSLAEKDKGCVISIICQIQKTKP